jgi:hypothetical protein
MITQPDGHHLAEFNFGTLRYAWDDPRLADFQDNLAHVNGIGGRSEGFVWRISDDAMDATQADPHGPLADRPNTASTLSVWEGPVQLWTFVEKTLHARFMARSADWFVPGDSGHFVGWWVPIGHQPTVKEGMEMWMHLELNGPNDATFDAATLAAMAKTGIPDLA